MTPLSVRGATVHLAGRPVLRGVDLDVGAGELVGVLGPNGAGKTTLLRAVLGLVPLSSGEVLLDGRSPRAVRRAVGYVPQRHDVAWDLPITVELAAMTARSGQLGLWRRPGRADWEAVAAALAVVDLSALADRPIGQLSGGQRQRVLVARALALEPRVLLLDEPVAGLDLPAQEHLVDLLVRLAAEGRAVVMTTHDVLGALEDCSRLVLVNGRVVADAAPSELRDPSAWAAAFGVGGRNPLLRLVEGDARAAR